MATAMKKSISNPNQHTSVYVCLQGIIVLWILLLIPFTTVAAGKHTMTPRQEKWLKLIPSHVKLQYAGNMGFLSIGTGWDYGKRNQWETDLFIGYLPKFESERAKLTFTLKQNFIPWKKTLNSSDFYLEPLTCGLYMNALTGDDFWGEEPHNYPADYWGFSSRIRFNLFVGQRLTYRLNTNKNFFAKEVTFFYELSTYDLMIASAFTNHRLRPQDYLSLSFGLKFQLK